jgi:hypothetical protein
MVSLLTTTVEETLQQLLEEEMEERAAGRQGRTDCGAAEKSGRLSQPESHSRPRGPSYWSFSHPHGCIRQRDRAKSWSSRIPVGFSCGLPLGPSRPARGSRPPLEDGVRVR